MKVREILTEGLSQDKARSIIAEFLNFVKKELDLDKLPKITLYPDSKHAINNKSFGGYSPSTKGITITIANRHIQDVLRTLAHEHVHYKQDINGQLNDKSGDDGSPEENEANSTAAVLLRKWGKLHPELFGFDAII